MDDVAAEGMLFPPTLSPVGGGALGGSLCSSEKQGSSGAVSARAISTLEPRAKATKNPEAHSLLGALSGLCYFPGALSLPSDHRRM